MIDDLRKWATPYTIAAAVVISLTTFGGYLLGNALSFFPTTSRGPAEWIAGIAIGSLWGHATLAAAWTVFGPLPLVQRLPIALAWCAALCLLALGVSGEAGLALASGVAIAIQWVTVQIVFWPVAAALSLRIDRPGEPDIDAGAYRQFRIGQLLILTTVVAVVLGIGRFLVAVVSEDEAGFSPGFLPMLVYIGAANAVATLPLLFALLLRRWAWVAGAVGLVFVLLVTLIELSLIRSRIPLVRIEDLAELFVGNAVHAAWVLGVLLLVRAGGYRLVPRWSASPALAEGRA